MKRALILGVGGQDGSYLTDILLNKDYVVWGFHRHSSVDNLKRIKHHLNNPNLRLVKGDITDAASVYTCIDHLAKDDDLGGLEIFNVADQDNVRWSKEFPRYQFDVTLGAVASLLYLLKNYSGFSLFQPVSATIFGDNCDSDGRQSESTPLNPQTPYAIAKAAVYHLCRAYRKDHGMNILCGIMFNHDSPRRAEGYLLNSICRQAAKVKLSKASSVTIYNPTLPVDVGYARDYMTIVHQLMEGKCFSEYCIGVGSIAPTVLELALMALGGDKDRIQKEYVKIVDSIETPKPQLPNTERLQQYFGGQGLHVPIAGLIQVMVDTFIEEYRHE